MSERRLMILRAALACACVAPIAASAQQAADLRERVSRMEEERDTAERTFTRLRDGPERSDSSVLTAGPISVLHTQSLVSETQLAALRGGIARGVESLRERFGEDGVSLLDSGAIWTLSSHPDRRWSTLSSRSDQRWSTLSTHLRGTRIAAQLRHPFNEDRIAQFLLQTAGIHFTSEIPLVAAYAESPSPLNYEPQRWEFAALELALSPAATARRCATGSIAACRTSLTRVSDAKVLGFHYEPGDHRTLVLTAPEQTTPIDSAFQVERTRCVDGDGLACTRIVGQLPVREPISASLRSTFLLHAMELGGSAAIGRLRDVRQDEVPVTAFARVAGVSEDSLISSWQRRVSATLDDSRPAAWPVFLSTALWCGVLLVGAARRKP